MCAVCFSSHQLCRVLIYVLITSNITLSAQMMTRVGAWASVKLFSTQDQGGITCGAIDEPRKSSKAIDERVIINFRYR